jgi:hypothetical protein
LNRNVMIVGILVGALVLGGVGYFAWSLKQGFRDMGEGVADVVADEIAREAAEGGLPAEAEAGTNSEAYELPADTPDYLGKQIAHLRALNQIMKKNLRDCSNMGTEIDAYMLEHEEEMNSLERDQQKALAGMSDSARKAQELRALKLIQPVLIDMGKVVLAVAFKCPQQAEAINQAKSRMGP